MRNLTTTICLTIAVLLGSVGMSWSADLQKGAAAYKSGDHATALEELLQEIISLRTGVITGFLAKTKQYANKIDAEVRRLKSDANDIRTSNTPERGQKGLADALNTIADLFYLQRKMMMYASLTSASTGVGVDKGTKILQKMQKQQKGQRRR